MKPILFLSALLALAPLCHAEVTISDLVAAPEIKQVKISPLGDYLAIKMLKDRKHILVFLDRTTLKTLGAFDTGGWEEVGTYAWANNTRVVMQLYEVQKTQEAPKFYGELAAVNFDGKDGEFIFGYRAHDQQVGTRLARREGEYAWGEVIDTLPEDNKHVLIASTPMQGQLARAQVKLLNVYTGEDEKRVRSAMHGYADFLTDKSGELRLISSYREDNSVHLNTLPVGAEDWLELPAQEYTDDFFPIAINSDGDKAFAADRLEQDKLGLYELELDGSGGKHLFTHDVVDISAFTVSSDGRDVYGLKLDDGMPSYMLFSQSEEAQVFKSLLSTFEGSLVDITSRSEDGKLWIVRVRSDRDPGAFYLFDREAVQLKLLFRSKPRVDASALAVVESISFESFDGTTIHGYLTQPPGGKGALVVLVHGGPRARDRWQFDSTVQVLATQGFGVLQVNYRGSSGYGLAFMDAGNRHWGDHIQQDIIAGTRWALAKGHARDDQVCIMGASFGAYSAAMSATLAPDLFACVVANAGIYDLSLMYKKGDIERFYGGENYLEEVIGRDRDQLKQFSPVNHVAALRAPVFIAHGKRDIRAPIAHANRLKAALNKQKKPYEWFVRKRESHGFYKDENQVKYLSQVLAFLRKHTSP